MKRLLRVLLELPGQDEKFGGNDNALDLNNSNKCLKYHLQFV